VRSFRTAYCDCGSSDGIGNQVVEVTVTGVRELQSAEANIVKGFVIKSEKLVGVLNKLLVDGKGCIVGLDNGVGGFGRWHDTVSTDDAVRKFLLDLGN
jgi:hypothetical protein